MSGLNVAAGSPALVSVVINCYNGERFLRQAIDSVYTQSWPNWEIVFWDNASADSTAEIARSYDSKLRYFRAATNTPLGEARNLAFAEARGKYIAMLDSDDVWMPDTLLKLVSAIEDGGVEYAVSYGGFVSIDASGREIGRDHANERRGDLTASLLKRFDIMPCASMVRRSILLETGHGFDLHLTTSEDYCFFMTLAVRFPFHRLGECVSFYRIHEGALTNKTISNWADEWGYTLDKIRLSNPDIDRRHPRPLRHAAAKVDYYRARNLIHKGDRAAARRLLRRNILVDFRYLALYLLALFPRPLWNRIHSAYNKRSEFS